MIQRRLEIRLLIIGALLLSASCTLDQANASQPPIARIVSIDYPQEVLSGSAFSVTVVVDYSDRVGVDVGIWDLRTGDVVQSISIPLQNTGEIPFELNLTSPTSPAVWPLIAVARIWWQDAWYQDPLQGSRSFTVNVSNTTTLTLASQIQTMITLDGRQYTLNASQTINLATLPGLHDLQASELIEYGAGERYVFVQWSDGVTSNPRKISITKPVTLAPQYRIEYYLTVKTQQGQVAGEGWYPDGSSPEFATIPTMTTLSWFGLVTENYKFTGWSGDSTSSELIASITMNSPKSVEANWAPTGMTINLLTAAYLLLVASVILALRGMFLYLQRKTSLNLLHASPRFLKLILPTILLVTVLTSFSPAYAQLPIQPRTSIVKIGDASWYYWNNTASDTCLLWLGGGTTNEQVVGYYSYEINPFQYESFGTIRFLQDLAKQYCVIALEAGSYASFSPNSTRTIYQEPYQMGSRIILQVRDWIRTQGYAHVFLVGYSSGAQVAAMEVAVSAPTEWTSPDGLILITPRLSEFVTQNAYRIHASLLVLYGGSIETPAYVGTGHEFYVNAPGDGWHASYYQKKEFEVIESAGHEVWTIFETGAYDTHALHSIVDFIDQVKSLQFTPQDVSAISNGLQNSQETWNSSSALTWVTAPSEVSPGNLLTIRVGFAYLFPEATETEIIAFDSVTSRIVSASTFVLNGRGYRTINLDFLPSANSSELSLSVIALRTISSALEEVAKPVYASIKMLQAINVTISSNAPNMTIAFDGIEHSTGTNGLIQMETRPGEHVIQASPAINLNSQTRLILAGWEDGSVESVRRLNLDNDTMLYANYRTQYFLNSSSVYGETVGSGWYDAGSVAAISVDPPMLGASRVIFTHWRGDLNTSDVRSLLIVSSPTIAIADWAPIESETNPSSGLQWFVCLFLVFMVTFAWNLRVWRREDVAPSRKS